jgi:uncharacterized glyoxalase superfamily protein PhnB
MPAVIPTIRISNRKMLTEWVEALGVELMAVYPAEGEAVDHAQLRFGGSWLMAGTPREGVHGLAPGHSSIYLVVDGDNEVDVLHARATAAGMRSEREPAEQDYGGRGCTLRDSDGNWWSIGSYRPSAE